MFVNVCHSSSLRIAKQLFARARKRFVCAGRLAAGAPFAVCREITDATRIRARV